MIKRSMGYSPLLVHMDHLLGEVAKANAELELTISSAANKTAALAAVNMEVLDRNDSSDDVIEMDLQRFEAGDPRLAEAHALERQVLAEPNRIFDEDVREMFHIPRPISELQLAPAPGATYHEQEQQTPAPKLLQLTTPTASQLPLAPTPAEIQLVPAHLTPTELQ